MKEVLVDTIVDILKLLPFLFVAFLFIELLEHKFSKKINKLVSNSGKIGPLIGGTLGIVPQCGFSVLATNLYVTRVITLGSLFSIYLSTSDEMIPVMISGGMPLKTILIILLFKFVCGVSFGFLIDTIIRKNGSFLKPNYDMCEHDHCDCKNNIFKSTIKHTLNTTLFVFVITLVLNITFHIWGESFIKNLFINKSIFGPFIGSLIGLIPNCGASIVITELYVNKVINLGTCISGLLTGSGVALLVLFKSNKNIRENIIIASILYLIGVVVGIFVEFFGIIL